MKRRLLPFSLLSIFLVACGTPTPGASTSETPSSGPSVTPSPTPSETPGVVANATCNELSFYLDQAIGSGYTCEIVPESTDELEPWPQHTRVTIEGYPLSGTFFPARISVFPVSDYSALRPEVPGLVTELQTLTGGGPAPVFSESFSNSPPFLPVVNAAQAFFARYEVVPFSNGSGVRFLTEITQYAVPVNNADLFYTYQALTDDGQYWISVTLPVNLASLPSNADDAMSGQSFEDWAANYEPYITGAVDGLNAQEPGSFTPTIDDLDALVASIVIEP